jgi:ABC-type Mn2+/Zn2+ transport system permease subunit
MQALRVLVVVMGVMIVLGMVALGVLLARRMAAPPAAMATLRLDEPAGTQILSSSLAGDTLVLTLRGGGADRVVLMDARGGRVVGRVELAK